MAVGTLRPVSWHSSPSLSPAPTPATHAFSTSALCLGVRKDCAGHFRSNDIKESLDNAQEGEGQHTSQRPDFCHVGQSGKALGCLRGRSLAPVAAIQVRPLRDVQLHAQIRNSASQFPTQISQGC